MTFELDQATLAAITQEVRQCFLDQDAPEYMEMLETGLKNRDGDFKSLLRAAHSLKGGAGVAELFSLKDLSHKLEDILQLLEKGQVQDVDMAWMLLEQGVSEMSLMLSQAKAGHEAEADPELMATLTLFHESQETEVEILETVSNVNSAFASISLQQDLEDSFARGKNYPLMLLGK